MRRVFEVDVLVCPRCTGRMRILAAIHSTAAIRAILECLGLPTRAPPIAQAVELFEEPEPHPWSATVGSGRVDPCSDSIFCRPRLSSGASPRSLRS
jgi:hypothetical protein